MSIEAFRTGTNSSAQQQAVEIAAMLFEERDVRLSSNQSTLSGGVIAGIVIGLLAIVLLLASVVSVLVLAIYCQHASKRYAQNFGI